MNDTLTKRQSEILQYMTRHQASYGIAATHRDIMEEFDLASPNGVHQHLQAMVKKGVLRKVGPGIARGYIPVQQRVDIDCPHCGNEIEVRGEL